MENRDILERPFGKGAIKTRKGRGSQKLSYIEGYNVIARLNEAFDGDWSFDPEIEVNDDRFIVIKGTLTAGGVSKSQYGSEEIKHYKESDRVVDIGFDFKAAATDALKKCATLFGVGLHMYGDVEKPQETRQQQNRENFNDAFENGGEPPQGKREVTKEEKGCWAISKRFGHKTDDFKQILYKQYEVDSTTKITKEQWLKTYNTLYGIELAIDEAGVTICVDKDAWVTFLIAQYSSDEPWSAIAKWMDNDDRLAEILTVFNAWTDEQTAQDEAEKDMPE